MVIVSGGSPRTVGAYYEKNVGAGGYLDSIGTPSGGRPPCCIGRPCVSRLKRRSRFGAESAPIAPRDK